MNGVVQYNFNVDMRNFPNLYVFHHFNKQKIVKIEIRLNISFIALALIVLSLVNKKPFLNFEGG